MLKFFAGLAIAILISACAYAQAFLPGVEDIPIMEGLRPIDGAGHIFDSPTGRLVKSYLFGTVSRRKVDEFYSEALPALGWLPTGSNTYTRDSEFLMLEKIVGDDGLTVTISISPRK